MKLTDEDKRRREALREYGSDTKAAEALGISQQAFSKWRKARGYSVRGKSGRPLTQTGGTR